MDSSHQISTRTKKPLALSKHLSSLPFFIINGIGLGGIMSIIAYLDWVNALWVLPFYYVRMFFVTGFFHRWFTHRSYSLGKHERLKMFIMGRCTDTTIQRGPRWWELKHLHHHAHSDTEEDVHSNWIDGFLWSHLGWIISGAHDDVDYTELRDYKKISKWPEVLMFEKPQYYVITPILLGVACFWLGGTRFLIEVFFGSTFLLYHGTFAINSLAHMWGTQRHETGDKSKNSKILSIITCGEGGHNDHHQNPFALRQGEGSIKYFDATEMVLRGFEYLDLIEDVKERPVEDRRAAEKWERENKEASGTLPLLATKARIVIRRKKAPSTHP